MNKKFIAYIQGSFEISAEDEEKAFELMKQKIDEQKFPIDSWKIADKSTGFVVKQQM